MCFKKFLDNGIKKQVYFGTKKKIEIDAEFFHHPIFHELFEDPLHLIGWPDWGVAGSWT